MRKTYLCLAIIVILSLMLAAAAWGQSPANCPAKKDWGQYYKIFDPTTIETYRGEVVTVDQLMPGGGMSNRAWLALNTDKGTILIIMGPTWYHHEKNFKIEPGDVIEVKGSMITSLEEPMVIAIEVKRGDQVLRLRDDSGYPTWAPPKGVK